MVFIVSIGDGSKSEIMCSEEENFTQQYHQLTYRMRTSPVMTRQVEKREGRTVLGY